MLRRILRLGLILACGVPALPGCETLKHETRPRSGPDEPRPAKAQPETGEAQPESGESTPAKGFFKPSRLSGALSSEGRDIERSLGVQ
jgi:hypothetical protein